MYVGRKARQLIRSTPFPQDLNEEIEAKYIEMCERYGSGDLSTDESGIVEGYVDCAVRSSATAEDLPDASFAGQQESYLNVHGVKGILEVIISFINSFFFLLVYFSTIFNFFYLTTTTSTTLIK